MGWQNKSRLKAYTLCFLGYAACRAKHIAINPR
jgi:hypothetical protein